MNLDVLSPRERTVVTHLRSGAAVKVIALELDLDPSTVSMHAATAARKLGLANRLSLVRGGDERRAADVASVLAELAPAEREVAALAVAGLSNAAIAALRGTAPRTIANQLARVYRKLGVGARAALVALAERRLSLVILHEPRRWSRWYVERECPGRGGRGGVVAARDRCCACGESACGGLGSTCSPSRSSRPSPSGCYATSDRSV